MAKRKRAVFNASRKARNAWIEYLENQTEDMFDIYESAANSLIAEINKFTEDGKVAPRYLAGLLNTVTHDMSQLREVLLYKLKGQMGRSIDFGLKAGILGAAAIEPGKGRKIGIGTSFIGKDGLVRRYDVRQEVFEASVWAEVKTKVYDRLIKIRPSGMPLSRAVWDVTYQSQKAIRNSINLAALEGQSAATLSKEVRGFLVEPKRTFRKGIRLGIPTPSKAAKAYHPGRGVYKSSFANSMRLARTEMARAYHNANREYINSKLWLAGAIWHTSSGEPCVICQDMDGQYFPKDEIPPIPHPHCYCYLENVIKGDPVPKGHELRPDTVDAIDKATAFERSMDF